MSNFDEALRRQNEAAQARSWQEQSAAARAWSLAEAAVPVIQQMLVDFCRYLQSQAPPTRHPLRKKGFLGKPALSPAGYVVRLGFSEYKIKRVRVAGDLVLVTPDARVWKFSNGQGGYVAVDSENILSGRLSLPDKIRILDDGRPYVDWDFTHELTPLQDVLAKAAQNICSSVAGRR